MHIFYFIAYRIPTKFTKWHADTKLLPVSLSFSKFKRNNQPSFFFVTVAVLLAALEWGLIPQTRQGFYCKDPTISFPFRGDTISMATLLIVSTIGPLIVIILTETLREQSFWKVRARIVWNWYKEFLIVYAMVLLFTEAAKVAFGEHRPHFLYTCVPDVAHKCESGAFIDEYKCTNDGVTNYLLMDSSRSFPSGHASVSFVAGTYSAVRTLC